MPFETFKALLTRRAEVWDPSVCRCASPGKDYHFTNHAGLDSPADCAEIVPAGRYPPTLVVHCRLTFTTLTSRFFQSTWFDFTFGWSANFSFDDFVGFPRRAWFVTIGFPCPVL